MPRSLRQPLGWLAASSLALLLLTGGSSTSAPAAVALPPGAVVPVERQRLLARRIGSILEEAHYRRATIDDRMSEQVLQHYLDSLDSQRSYFLASDIEEFSALKHRFDDIIHTGQLEPAFLIFSRFQQRNRERIAYALGLLKSEPDWTLDESFEFDRSKAPWPADAAELNELWRKRVKSDALSLLLTGKTWAEATDTLKSRYERVLKRADQVNADDVFENLMNAYARTFDPHSSYFSARNSEEYRIQMSLSYEGIGATLQSTDDYASIVNLLPGGPAAVSGALGIKDRITAIAQGSGAFQDVIGWRLDDVVQLIRGKGGTQVRLQILPAGAAPGTPEKIVELTRGKVTLEAQAAKKQRKLVTRNGRTLNLGVISVPGFYQDVQAQSRGDENYRSTTRDVQRLIGELRQEGPLDGLILDLRGDGGGFLPEATALTGLFIDQGPVVQLKDTTGRVEVLDDPDPGIVYDGPLVVLIDRLSASASEIFAGAIQDYGRGYIVGQRSFGKGTVQNLIPLDRWSQRPVDGQLTVTIGKFYRVTGESTQHRGVEPDIHLPSPISLDEVGESALDEALPWDRIAAAPFTPFRQPAALPTALSLAQNDNARSQSDPDYRLLIEDIQSFEAQRQKKTLSLNLEQRRAERTKLEAERLARENARRTAHGKKALTSLSASGEDEAAEGAAADDQDLPDTLLNQTAQILGDILSAESRAQPAIAREQRPAAAAP
ncbi:MAG: carboxy terminal-processing peptidase [Steroidobacteraceae bacterium]